MLLLASSCVRSNEEGTREAPPQESRPQIPTLTDYAGSAECEGCHYDIYARWKTTRHSYSFLSGDEARIAGYPLLRTPTIRTWDDVLYVVGGRKRIAYIDQDGLVQDQSFHHRIGDWNGFPSKLMECGSCHATGFDPSRPSPVRSEIPGGYAELNIGCEACHGPGMQHSKTLEKEDIVLDISSRVCGKCHTTLGRVLPADDHHDTHDLVQVWNDDPHVTGVRQNSTDAFCSRCHAPDKGEFLENDSARRKLVFSESKQNITCMACHDPHGVTHSTYRRERVTLEPPRMPRAHIFSGNDEDFTTLNYTELGGVEENCTSCHSGADRIDLDHGNATCTDCHNTFWHNSRPESRVFHDANRPDLNCRTCHRDADHLVTLVFNDREFLQPRYIHNLRRLPTKVVEKYAFRYPRMRAVADRGHSSQYSGDNEPVEAPEQTTILVDRGVREPTPPGPDWFLGNAIASVVEDDLDRAVLSLQNAFEAEPLDLLIGFSIPSLHQFRAENFDEEMLTNRSLLPELGSYLDEYIEPPLRAWLVGFYDLVNLRFAEAETAFREVARLAPDSGSGWFYVGWSQLLAGKPDEALTSFDRVLEVRPSDTAARTARGIAYLRKKQFRNAREELTKAIDETTHRAIPYYFLGIGYAAQPDLSRSVQAFQNSLGYDPGFLEAYFALGVCAAEGPELGG